MMHAGKVMEVLVAFVLGIIKASLGDAFDVAMTVEDDDSKVDFRINGRAIQQKFGWKPDDRRMIAEKRRICQYIQEEVLFIIIERYDRNGKYSIMDTLEEMLRFAGISDETIKKELDEDPAFDAAEELWVWFCARMRLKKIPALHELWS